MALRYCDHGAYAAYAATPTWGVPQEGDGLAKAVSSAAAIASINFSAPPTTGVITVMGVAIVLTSVLSQTTADIAANNLASSINAMATTVAAGVSNTTPQLRNLVFARGPAGGAPSGTCQIMTRVGAVGLNYASNTACLIVATFNNVTSSAANLQFSGGTSGCYGYFANEVTPLWPQALTTWTYGLLGSTQRPLAGYPNAGDVVKIRCGKTLTTANAVNVTVTTANGGTTTSPVIWDFDDGTEWPADGVNPKFVMIVRVDGTGAYAFGAGTGVLIVRAKKYSDDTYNFTLALTGTNSAVAALTVPACMPATQWYNVHFDGTTYNTGTGGVSLSTGGGSVTSPNINSKFYGCRFAHKNKSPFVVPGANTYNIDLQECTFSNAGASIKNDGIVSPGVSTGVISMTGARFEGFIIGSALVVGGNNLASASTTASQLIMKDTRWGNVSARGPLNLVSSAPVLIPYAHSTFAGSSVDTEDSLLDTKQGFEEWNALRSQPTLNAKLSDGITPMSKRFIASTQSSNISFLVPFEMLPIAKKNTLASGQRTIVVHFCLEENLAWNKGLIWPVFEYIDTAGKLAIVDGFDASGGALEVSTATWSQEAAGKVTYVDGGTLNHNKYKFTISTIAGRDMAINTKMILTVRIAGLAGNVTQGGFLCPEFLVS